MLAWAERRPGGWPPVVSPALTGIGRAGPWYLGGAALAGGTGLLLSWKPAVLAGVLVVALVVGRPQVAAHLLIASEGTILLWQQVSGSYTLVTAGEYAVCLVALLAAAAWRRSLSGVWLLAGGVAVLTPWLIYGILDVGAAQALTGLRLTLWPLMAAALGLSGTRADLKRLLTTTAAVLAVNAVAAWYERRIGVDGLLARGLTYGEQVTEIGDNVLRAPGLMRNSFHLGLFAAGFLAVLSLSILVVQDRTSRLTVGLGVPAALACLLLSTSRTSLVVVGVAGLLCVQMSERGTRFSRFSRLLAAVVLPSLPVAVVVIGAGSAASLTERFSVWAGFFDSRLTVLGHGLGSLGAASFSRYSNSDPVFVDNYWLSVAYQFGGAALLVVYLGLVILMLAILGRRIAHPSRRAASAVLVTVAASSMLLEVWEYPGVMCLLGYASGHWWAAGGSGAAEPRNATTQPDRRPVMSAPKESM